MNSYSVPHGALVALAGATLMVAASSSPSSAFTLSAPAVAAAPAATADIEHVWWDRWGR